MEQHEYCTRADRAKVQLYRTALAYTGNEDAAVEAVDQAVYKGLLACHKLRQPEFFETWLTRILINTCRDEHRRRQRETPVEALPEQAAEAYDALPLRQAVAALPPDLRAVIVLRFFAQLGLEQTAQALGLPRGTVSSRQKKALGLLRVELTEEEA